MDNQTIGQIICTYRKKKGLTQKALAEQLNVTDKAVSKWERDIARPDINTIPKLAEILDVSVEELMNIPVKAKPDPEAIASEDIPSDKPNELTNDADLDNNWDPDILLHKEKMKRLLLQGLIGICAGILFSLIVSSESGIGYAILVGLFLAGVPYGWELVGSFLGNWVVVGHIAIMIIFFVIRFVLAVLIGWAAYPIALTYSMMKAQRRGSKSRTVLKAVYITMIVLIVAFVAILIALGIYDNLDDRNMQSGTGAAVSQTEQNDQNDQDNQSEQNILEAKCFSSANAEYISLCKEALENSRVSENESKENGQNILRSSEIKGAYFLTVNDATEVHTNYAHSIKVKNVLLIVTSYFVEQPGWFEREEWTIWGFPNFSVDKDNVLTYDSDNIYNDVLLSESLEDIYEWICTEYDDMIITELDIPDVAS